MSPWMNKPVKELTERYPFMTAFLEGQGITGVTEETHSLSAMAGDTSDGLLENAAAYLKQMLEFLGESHKNIESLSILPGHDKSGNAETFDRLDFTPGDVISIVGPTGSGKSRLLGDIEWVAQGDTPTGRTIEINGRAPDASWRMNPSEKLVAQLSQNMNFVMDLTVREFLEMHAESRMVPDRQEMIDRIIERANVLCGEAFSRDSAVTALSGGQSRALMIADTALLSTSPVVLIDEIENAGIDRKKALQVLLSEGKIVLLATHDPLLALMADTRLVIGNGGISRVMKTTDQEKTLVKRLEEEDRKMQWMRNDLRHGKELAK